MDRSLAQDHDFANQFLMDVSMESGQNGKALGGDLVAPGCIGDTDEQLLSVDFGRCDLCRHALAQDMWQSLQEHAAFECFFSRVKLDIAFQQVLYGYGSFTGHGTEYGDGDPKKPIDLSMDPDWRR